MATSVRVQLYATARQAVGRSAVEQEVPSGGIPARELVDALATQFPPLRRILRSSRFLRNDRYLTDLEERVRPGDVFAVHPPYGGG